MKGVFTISLDFELHWGGFEKWPLSGSGFRESGSVSDSLATRNSKPETFNLYFLNTRAVIPRILSLFGKYEVHATWAGVGMLMHKDKESLLKNFPELKPSYKHQELSAYNYINEMGIGDNEETDPFHYADSLVQRILQTKNQELGSHSFSHFYCNETGQTLDQFRADLKSAQKAAMAYGVKLRSLVFPRNQFNDEYLKVCFEEGFESVRSNPLDWFWDIQSTQGESKWKRLNRGMDAYIPLGKKNTYNINSIEVRNGFPVCLPASRLLRPYNPSELFLNQLKIDRIKTEMKQAAKAHQVYHLWWHPHNFGNYPEQSLTALEQILIAYKSCEQNWEMKSLNMGELTDLIKNIH